MGRFDDKVAIVTGGSKGIGEAIVNKLFDENARVAILDIDEKAAKDLALKLDPTGGKTLGIGCDVTKRSDVRQAFQKTVENFGTVDILVNNAGITQDAIFHKMTEQQWDDVISVNGKGIFNCSQEAWGIMKEKKYGKICNLSSINSSGEIGQANYAYTKAGINGFTKSLAKEGGRHNINVNSVRPAVIDTDMLRAIPEKNLQDLVDGTVFKRLGTASEVADVVAYLCSDESSWVTGEELLVAGGFMMR